MRSASGLSAPSRRVSPDRSMNDQLESGRQSQRCPCGVTEAAGPYCSACCAPTGPPCWFRGEASQAKRAAIEAARSARHHEPELRSPLTKSAPAATQAGPGLWDWDAVP
jgi:hypothetical protein